MLKRQREKLNDNCVLKAINKKTKAIILQDTFGRLGLREETINMIKKKKIFIIEDVCLSIGSKFKNSYLGQHGDLSIFSLEVSKTITLGWGGVLKINNINYKKKIIKSYKALSSINKLSDLKRLFQLTTSLYLLKYPKSFGHFIWYFFYGTRIFRKSDTGIYFCSKKIGPLTKIFFLYLFPKFTKFYKTTNKNYMFFISQIKKANLKSPIIQRKNEFIVTPRIPLIVKNKSKIIQLAKKMKIEIGEWFTECPPKLNLEKSNYHSYKTGRLISGGIINIPCYFSLDKKEIIKLKKLISQIGLIEKN